MELSQRMLRAAGWAVCLAVCLWGAAPATAQTAQVTSEITCTTDAQCPNHGGLCFAKWLPGCGCDEGRGRCDANPKDCLAASDCFGEEICSNDNRCVEPGPREGTPCNADVECAEWMSCLLGQCSRGECVADSDCSDGRVCTGRNSCVRPPCTQDGQCDGGQVCRGGECLAVDCISNAECGAREVCSNGSCNQVECREVGDCTNCSVCDSSNSCLSLCREGEQCFAFPGLGTGNQPFVVRQCSEPHQACESRTQCPISQHCIGGHCTDLRALLNGLNFGLSRNFEVPPRPPKEKDPGKP
jgi:hypothetical protein